MKFLCGFLSILAVSCQISAKESQPKWISDNLAPEYRQISESTDAIVLYSSLDLECNDGVISSHQRRLLRLTKIEGLQYSIFHLETIKGHDFSDFSGYRYDRSGQLKEKLTARDILHTAFSKSFYDDSEQLTATFKSAEVGDVIAFEYTHEFKTPLPDIFIPMRDDIEVAYQSIQIPQTATAMVLNDPGKTISSSGRSFSVQNQPALPREDNSPPMQNRIPILAVSLESKSPKTWAEVSGKYWKDTQKQSRLSANNQKDLNKILSISDKGEFIKAVADYVSHTIQYVDIEFGKGAYIPRDCNFVHEKKYGDCKDMAFYAISILREKGITAYPVLARPHFSGCIFKDYPAFQFNHVIMAVELDSGTADMSNAVINEKPYLIVDLTDRYTQIPVINRELEDTYILPVFESGAALEKLPLSSSDKHIITFDFDLTLNDDRSLEVNLLETREGHYAAQTKAMRSSMASDKEKEMMTERIHQLIPGASLKDFSYEELPDKVITRFRFLANNFGSDAGDKIFLIPNLVDARKNSYSDKARDADIDLSYRSTIIVNVLLNIAGSFQILSIPENASMDNEVFTCAITASRDRNHVTWQKRFAWKTNRISKEKYPEFRQSYRDHLKTAKSPVVLQKSGNQ
jgi:hypothetical protein